MPYTIADALRQKKPFASLEQEVVLGLLTAAARVEKPFAKFLKTTAQLTNTQSNVRRILRGSHPSRRACGDIAVRMIHHDPDITRLKDLGDVESLGEPA